MRKLYSEESSDFLNIASCVTYDDILYNELHNLKPSVGELIHIRFSDDKDELVEVTDIEFGDGTIWLKLIEGYYD